MTRIQSHRLDALFRLLVAYRLLVYFGGLFLIGLPLLFRALGVEFSGTARTVLIVLTLAVMVLTYIGERRIGIEHAGNEASTGERRTRNRAPTGTEPSDPTYSRRTRALVAVGLLGVAIGIYVAIEGETIIGIVFIVGGLLFGQVAFGTNDGDERTDGEPER